MGLSANKDARVQVVVFISFTFISYRSFLSFDQGHISSGLGTMIITRVVFDRMSRHGRRLENQIPENSTKPTLNIIHFNCIFMHYQMPSKEIIYQLPNTIFFLALDVHSVHLSSNISYCHSCSHTKH